MSWRLILQLSMFGLAMGVATVFFIGSRLEPVFWLVIFLFCAYVIARERPDSHFTHGLLLGLANSVWITGAHILLFDQYLASHAREAGMMKSMPFNPRLLMAITGPMVGVVSGVVIGILAVIAGKVLKRAPAAG
ncbi:MAG TPA: hypothetical protein VEU96_15110 [Bryobacteraceae bacterium]|nr:hypothetical protein [Bryobacteraceae bacterium]